MNYTIMYYFELVHYSNQFHMKNIGHGIANILAFGSSLLAQKLCA